MLCLSSCALCCWALLGLNPIPWLVSDFVILRRGLVVRCMQFGNIRGTRGWVVQQGLALCVRHIYRLSVRHIYHLSKPWIVYAVQYHHAVSKRESACPTPIAYICCNGHSNEPSLALADRSHGMCILPCRIIRFPDFRYPSSKVE